MAPDVYDPAIQAALVALNRLPGVRTTASCQGKSRPDETSTHADLAYVRFADPVPLGIEEELIRRVGGLSRVEPGAVYCRRLERNDAFCTLLEQAAAALAPGDGTPDRGIAFRRPDIRKLLLQHLETAPGAAPGICRRCRSLVSGAGHCDEATLALLPPGFGGLDAILERFLREDPDPPDPRLVAREGAGGIRRRILHGDFGDAYRRQWLAFLHGELDRLLREDVRQHLATLRTDGRDIDLRFENDTVIFEVD